LETFPLSSSVAVVSSPPSTALFFPSAFEEATFTVCMAFELPVEGLVVLGVDVVEGATVKLDRRQLAIVPGYAFTDYKAQGQTMEFVIVDISKPPSGFISPFSMYVALSRSRGRNSIRILRDFDPALFMHHPSEDLRLEMLRLELLNERTLEAYEREQQL